MICREIEFERVQSQRRRAQWFRDRRDAVSTKASNDNRHRMLCWLQWAGEVNECAEELKKYRFASKRFDHKFCGVCGTSIGVDFLGLHEAGDIISINVCCPPPMDPLASRLGESYQRDTCEG